MPLSQYVLIYRLDVKLGFLGQTTNNNGVRGVDVERITWTYE
jgi:hypothetical protein